MSSNEAEYQALRDTIRERGTARLSAVLGGLVAWGALVIAMLIAELEAITTLVPLLVLAATFEINFFMHTGVERIGRYIQVFYEERADAAGWETTAMNYGAKFPPGLDPLFSMLFAGATSLNVLASLLSEKQPGTIAVSLGAHIAFGYRIVSARKRAASQRALDLERFRNLAKPR
jgi:hypothetical protein